MPQEAPYERVVESLIELKTLIYSLSSLKTTVVGSFASNDQFTLSDLISISRIKCIVMEVKRDENLAKKELNSNKKEKLELFIEKYISEIKFKKISSKIHFYAWATDENDSGLSIKLCPYGDFLKNSFLKSNIDGKSKISYLDAISIFKSNNDSSVISGSDIYAVLKVLKAKKFLLKKTIEEENIEYHSYNDVLCKINDAEDFSFGAGIKETIDYLKCIYSISSSSSSSKVEDFINILVFCFVNENDMKFKISRIKNSQDLENTINEMELAHKRLASIQSLKNE